MARGRKSKPGKREPNGRLLRNSYPHPVYDRGSEWVQRMRAQFGEHYNSALGRAYAAGLLGDEAMAKNRLDAGKRFQRLNSAIIGSGGYRCPLDPSPRCTGQRTAFHGQDEGRDEQDWLFAAMNALDRAALRPWLDQLLSGEYTDAGPVWLTRILRGGRDPYDLAMLKHSIDALDIIAPQMPRARILSVVS